MKKLACLAAILLMALLAGQASAASWYRISFTGNDMFNYTASVDELYNQDAPRRLRQWDDDTLLAAIWSNTDTNTDGLNDYHDWASGNLVTYQIAYFNLWGEAIAANYWDQPYEAVPDNGDGTFGVNSWRVVESPAGWTSGIVMANQPYNTTDHAFPVWRAPEGAYLGLGDDARFTFDVLIANPESAFEPDGRLRVWFGGFNTPQGTPGPTDEMSGIMLLDAVPIPLPSALLLVGIGTGLTTWLRRRSAL